jgi:hypothetical protein
MKTDEERINFLTEIGRWEFIKNDDGSITVKIWQGESSAEKFRESIDYIFDATR